MTLRLLLLLFVFVITRALLNSKPALRMSLRRSAITAIRYRTAPILVGLCCVSMSALSGAAASTEADVIYPGTAVERMMNIRNRVRNLTPSQLTADWSEVRPNILWAGGLRDLQDAVPGQGYTGHSFNDFNHCDLTAMKVGVQDSNNQGKVAGIAYNNPLGNGIRIASLEELGPGGSWSTCMIGCNQDPPRDVAHLQFQSRIAFKLVWAPPEYTSFVLVDDDGEQLAAGHPTGTLPSLQERAQNYAVVRGSKYARAADRLAAEVPPGA